MEGKRRRRFATATRYRLTARPISRERPAERLSGTEPQRRKFNWSRRERRDGAGVTLQQLRVSRSSWSPAGLYANERTNINKGLERLKGPK